MMNVCAQWWVLVSEFRRRSISDGGDESLFLAMNSWVWFQHRFQSSWVLLGFITVSGQGEFLGGVMDPVLGPRFSGSFLHMCLYFVFFGFITVSGRDEFLCGVMYPVLGPTFSGIFGFLLGFGFITVSGLWWISVWGDGSCLGAMIFLLFCVHLGVFWISSPYLDTMNFCVGWWILSWGHDFLFFFGMNFCLGWMILSWGHEFLAFLFSFLFILVSFGFIIVSGHDEFLCGVMDPVLGPRVSGYVSLFFVCFGFHHCVQTRLISVWGGESCFLAMTFSFLLFRTHESRFWGAEFLICVHHRFRTQWIS